MSSIDYLMSKHVPHAVPNCQYARYYTNVVESNIFHVMIKWCWNIYLLWASGHLNFEQNIHIMNLLSSILLTFAMDLPKLASCSCPFLTRWTFTTSIFIFMKVYRAWYTVDIICTVISYVTTFWNVKILNYILDPDVKSMSIDYLGYLIVLSVFDSYVGIQLYL